MPQPRFLIDELLRLMRGKSLDERSGQRMIAHVVQGRVVDHVVGVAGTQQVEEVQTTLAARRASDRTDRQVLARHERIVLARVAPSPKFSAPPDYAPITSGVAS